MPEGVYDTILGKMGMIQTKAGGLKLTGRITKGSDTSPTAFYLVDSCGTYIGADLREITVLDYAYSPLLDGKEYVDRVI